MAKRLLPWGNNVAKNRGRVNAQGQGPAKPWNKVRRGCTGGAPSVPAVRASMDYPANDPLQWPIAGGKRTTTPDNTTQAKADKQNAIVNKAYLRTTGLS